VDWLCAEAGIDSAEVAGVGDSDADLAFLDKVGFSAGPANATGSVRAAVDYVSSEPEGRGLVDIVERVTSANRRIAAE
jgi:3-deoxy-D-manno-octulosonate 8-phosphate phosphatase KdsC-like HAD superfamily phosphatase